jgi:hypothetical protein
MEQDAIRESADKHVFLIGRPPLGEFLGYVSTQTLEGQANDGLGAFAQEWRAANDHILELQQIEAGLADGVSIVPLPTELEEAASDLQLDPAFNRSFGVVPADIGMVELDRLVVFQKTINLAHAEKIKAGLPANPSDADLFRVCFSPGRPPVKMQQMAETVFAFASPSTDFRVLGLTLLDPASLGGHLPGGHASAVLAVPIGYGVNYLSAIQVEGRLVLNNGSHRAYALREAGVQRVPCVVQHVTRRDELGVIGSPDLQRNLGLYLEDPRPPLLKDYFDDRLRKIVSLPRRTRQVRVQIAIEKFDIAI